MCLTCEVRTAIQNHFIKNGAERGGERIINVPQAMDACAEVLGELVACDPRPAKRNEACLELAKRTLTKAEKLRAARQIPATALIGGQERSTAGLH